MLILVGASASGKTELAKKMRSIYGYKKIITTTTRKPRVGEFDNVDYHFLSKEDFLLKLENQEFAEYSIYNSNYYGLQKKDIDNKGIVILEPEGANAIFKLLKDEVYIVLIESEKDKRYKRMKNRNDDENSINKRLANDDLRFSYNNLDKIHLVLKNNDETFEKLAEIVHENYQLKISKID